MSEKSQLIKGASSPRDVESGAGHQHGPGCSHDHGAGGHSHGAQDQGHSHGGGGHQHGSGCSHDHGAGGHSHGGHGHGGHGHGDIRHTLFKYKGTIRIVHHSLHAVFWLVGVYFLIPPLADDSLVDYWCQVIFLSFLYVMCGWTFHHAATTDNTPPKVETPPAHTTFQKTPNDGKCEKCKQWKPARTHHCSVCNKCTLMMDHHCPWVANCIGAYNHKSFLLYNVYSCIAFLQYFWRSLYMLYLLYDASAWSNISTMAYIGWAVLSIATCLFIYMAGQLALFHSCAVLNNLSTLETMSSGKFKNPCTYYPQPVNVYDRGYLGNLMAQFSGPSWTFWLPLEVEHPTDATSFQNNSLWTTTQFAEVKNRENPVVLSKYAEGKLDYKKLLQDADRACDGKDMKYNGRTHEFRL